jgi:hypothetical protein
MKRSILSALALICTITSSHGQNLSAAAAQQQPLTEEEAF